MMSAVCEKRRVRCIQVTMTRVVEKWKTEVRCNQFAVPVSEASIPRHTFLSGCVIRRRRMGKVLPLIYSTRYFTHVLVNVVHIF